MRLDGLARAERAASVQRGLSLRQISGSVSHVAQAMLGLEESVRSVRLALSLMQRARAASGAMLALRAVMVRAPRVLMERRSTT